MCMGWPPNFSRIITGRRQRLQDLPELRATLTRGIGSFPGSRRTMGGYQPILLGTLLGEEVVHVSDGIGTVLTNTTIKTAWKTISVPAKSGDEESATGATASINIAVATLGDIAFVGWGGEVFNEIGKAVKEKSPFRQTFVLTHCNGAAGYLPTSSSYSEGGYEV